VLTPVLSMNCTAPGAVVQGASYSASCTGSSGIAPYAWTFTSLPSWLTPSSTTAPTITLTGTAPAPATFSFTITLTDSSSPKQSIPVNVSIVVSGNVTITPSVAAPNQTTLTTGFAQAAPSTFIGT